jgi:hypothetical protein
MTSACGPATVLSSRPETTPSTESSDPGPTVTEGGTPDARVAELLIEWTDQITRYLPDASHAEISQMLDADGCQTEDQLASEPDGFVSRIPKIGSWIEVTTDDLLQMQSRAGATDVPGDAVEVPRVGRVISGDPPDSLLVTPRTLQHLIDVAPMSETILLGVPENDASARVAPFARFPGGTAVFASTCMYPFFTMPLLQAAQDLGLPPADLITRYAEDPESPFAAAVLEHAADRPSWTWEDLAPTERTLAPEDAPAAVLATLVPFDITVRVPVSWADLDAMICTFSGLGWNDCVDLSLVPELPGIPLRGHVAADGTIDIVLFEVDAPLSQPLGVLGSVNAAELHVEASGDDRVFSAALGTDQEFATRRELLDAARRNPIFTLDGDRPR